MITQKTLIMLYYSLICSRIQYGIVLWGTAAKARLQEINVRLNNIVRSITRSGKYAPVTPLYNHLNILKLDDIYRLELAKIMYQLSHHLLLKTLQVSFTKVSGIHEHNTRFTENSGYFLSRVNKSIGKRQLRYRGLRLWNDISPELKELNWILFKKKVQSTSN